MLNKKFLSGAILTAAVCLTACSNGGNEVSETVSETLSETATAAAETALTTSETTAETTTETTASAVEIIDTSGIEYMKEALQADWNDSEYDRFAVSVVNLYTADLNGDGIDELFVNYSFGAAMNGLVYVYDVSDGMKKLYEISARMWTEKSELYKDESGTVHLILKEGYAGGIGELDTAYFDITYDSIKMPIYVKEYDWYDGGAHLLAYDLYKNCEFVPLEFINDFSGWRNFDPEKAEYIGRFDTDDVSDAFNKGESNEISDIVQKEVFEGLTYVSDVEEIYEGSIRHEDFEDFDGFWQQAAPKLAEVYGGAVSTEIIDTSGVEYMKEALQANWEYVTAADICASDLNGDGVNELFVKYLLGPMKNGIIYVYDVSDGMKKLYEISVSNSKEKLYTDENGIVHFVLKAHYSGNSWEDNFACFDITYDSIKMPFYVYIHDWFDGGAHVFDYNIYKNCEVVPTNEVNRNFDPEKAELIGTYNMEDILKAWKEEESNEVSEIIQKEVYDGLTYTSDTTEVYFGSSYDEETKRYEIEWDFEKFWQEAAPKLAEVYG